MHSKQEHKLKIFWLQGLTCNGNAHSFLNLEYLEELLEKIEFLYHPLLPAKETLSEMAKCKTSCDILIFEGAYDPSLKRADTFVDTMLHYYAKKAKYIIAVGTCASFGGIFKASSPQTNSGILFNEEQESGPLQGYSAKIINLSGCPVHPEWLGSTLNMIVDKHPVVLDKEHRPKELYSSLVHHGCTRNEYFEWKIDADDFGQKEGCLFYKQGCRAPMTHGSCNTILWNGVNSKTRSGTPCFGCTESDFPRTDLFETKTNMSIPVDAPLGVPKRAYLTLTGIAKTFHIKRLEEPLIDYKNDN